MHRPEVVTNFRLVDLAYGSVGLARVRHGLAARSHLRHGRRAVEVGTEVLLASLMDRLRPLRSEVRRLEAGLPPSGAGCLGVYAHWSPSGRVSEMVFHQLDAWRAEGFDLVFVTNASPPTADWERLAAHCMLRIERDDTGRDFGAWRDALPIALTHFGFPQELLLANDSVLGPIRPLRPIVAALRAGGNGLFGLTESRGGGTHLQSYVLLARGEATIAEVGRHLAACSPSRSKWLLVQKGEIGLTRRMLQKGHRVAALFSYDGVVGALDQAMLRAIAARFEGSGALDRYPLNPTHHVWRLLVERFGFPYIKTDLVLRNPLGLPDVEAWPQVVGPEDPVRLEAHLKLMSEGASGRAPSRAAWSMIRGVLGRGAKRPQWTG